MGVGLERADGAPALTVAALPLVLGLGLVRAGWYPAVELPMPTFRWGLVTPTCGLGRATVALAHGDLGTAVALNPASVLLAVAVVVVAVRALLGVTTGAWLSVHRSPSRRAVLLSVGALVLALGIHQQSQATIVMGDRAPDTVAAIGWCPLG